MSHAALVRAFAIAAFSLCFVVVVLGAYVRLSAAGLGCPDWPGCYGHLTPTGAAAALNSNPAGASAAATPARVNVGKAWREMIHRYAASTLGLLVVCLTAMAIAWRRERVLPILYMLALLGAVTLQGALGMLTVTWQLRPLIVTGHLLFGLLTLSLLWWLVLTLLRRGGGAWGSHPAFLGSAVRRARQLALLALAALLLQIALGGWTSSNYAATACPDLPTCQGSWWPPADFEAGFVLWRGLDINYEGGVLANPARVAIQVTHRLGALVATLALLAAVIAALRYRYDRLARRAALFVLAALLLQLCIGLAMVLRGFPLWLATAHNAGAALLLLAAVALNRALRPA
jgi:cytochrome c oxidase assembly protein subunit 15